MPVNTQLVRFGVFELDLISGELCKNGRKLRLQEQPFRLLHLLLEHPGQAVTRDRLKEALWPADTFVDFDHSLNAAIGKLRQALSDSAENPRFIERWRGGVSGSSHRLSSQLTGPALEYKRSEQIARSEQTPGKTTGLSSEIAEAKGRLTCSCGLLSHWRS